MDKTRFVWAFLRLAMGWLLLWTFIDKFPAWLDGTSPTTGFLKFGTSGPLASFYQGLAGSVAVDWLYMVGLALMGIALIVGIGVKIAGYAGALFMILLYSAALPPEHNPFLDEHLVYVLVLIGLALSRSGHTLGLGRWWANTGLVKRFPFLE